MLYEVTGMRLNKEDFQSEDNSSGSEGNEQVEELLPMDYAMMDMFDEEGEDQNSAAIYSLNE